ncbi:hypothetical protein PABG_04464 [Paracoccidioides brasiliensis Pb03]|nr:hypothetical protein PABG_04464 [Paracoccidioides brasiliensis Pb03]
MPQFPQGPRLGRRCLRCCRDRGMWKRPTGLELFSCGTAELRDTDGGARKEETRGEERIVRNERENKEDGGEMFERREEEVYIV